MKHVYAIILLLLTLAAGLVGGFYFGFNYGLEKFLQESTDNPSQITAIDSFKDCVAAGYAVAESYPRQCRTSDGRNFIEEINQDTALVPGPITISGQTACLPKIGGELQTLECAVGLKGENNLYYGLKNLSELDPINKFSVSGRQIKVSGTLALEKITGPDGNQYDVVGVIDITSINEIKNGNEVVEGPVGTITGTVFLGSTCPTEEKPPDQECAKKPYQTKLLLISEGQTQTSKEFESDSNGTFEIQASPGRYTIVSTSFTTEDETAPNCQSDNVVISINGHTETTVYCDS
jgi:hypothetical protein